jgi:hypothetical protein
VVCALRTARLVEELRQAEWKPSPKTDADAECEFRYQPDGWSKPYRFVALRCEKTRYEQEAEEPEQYRWFETSRYKYRVFVTDFQQSGQAYFLTLMHPVLYCPGSVSQQLRRIRAGHPLGHKQHMESMVIARFFRA